MDQPDSAPTPEPTNKPVAEYTAQIGADYARRVARATVWFSIKSSPKLAITYALLLLFVVAFVAIALAGVVEPRWVSAVLGALGLLVLLTQIMSAYRYTMKTQADRLPGGPTIESAFGIESFGVRSDGLKFRAKYSECVSFKSAMGFMFVKSSTRRNLPVVPARLFPPDRILWIESQRAIQR